MSLATNITNAMTRIATELKAIRTLVNGNAAGLSALTTTNKANLVAAINEVAAAVGGAGASINDTGTSSVTVWSSTKTDAEIDAAVAALVAAAPGTLDTLNELAAAIGDDPNYVTTITTALGLKAPMASPTFTGTVTVPDGVFTIGKTTGLQTALDAKVTGFVDPNADRIVFWDDSASAYAALSLTGLTITNTVLTVDAASTTAAGKVELATDVEAATTDSVRALTPANLMAVMGDSTTNFVTTFEAGLV